MNESQTLWVYTKTIEAYNRFELSVQDFSGPQSTLDVQTCFHYSIILDTRQLLENTDMIQIQSMSSYFEITKDGYIINPASLNKIQEK